MGDLFLILPSWTSPTMTSGTRFSWHQEHRCSLLEDWLSHRGFRPSLHYQWLKNLMAVAAVTDITFKEAETMKAFLADPTAFAVAAPVAAAEAVVEEAAAPEPESRR